jgi:hypothetical protein
MTTFRHGTRFSGDTVLAAVVTVEADRQEDQEEVLAEVLVMAVEEEAAVVAPREVGKWRIPKFFLPWYQWFSPEPGKRLSKFSRMV